MATTTNVAIMPKTDHLQPGQSIPSAYLDGEAAWKYCKLSQEFGNAGLNEVDVSYIMQIVQDERRRAKTRMTHSRLINGSNKSLPNYKVSFDLSNNLFQDPAAENQQSKIIDPQPADYGASNHLMNRTVMRE